VFILRDILNIKEALRHIVISDEWCNASGGSKHAAEFEDAVAGRGSVFWQQAPMVLKLMAPLMDAIHTIEADRPMLSQMLMMWETLVIHVEEFCADASHVSLLERPSTGRQALPGQDGDDMMTVLRKRLLKTYHKSFPAAFFLDPINFQEKEGKWSSPDAAILSPRQREDAISVICRLTGATTEDEQVAVATEFTCFQLRFLPAELSMFMTTLTSRTRDKVDGRVKAAPVEDRRALWEKYLAKTYPKLAIAASRLLAMHVTTCSSERNWSMWGNVYTKARNRLQITRAEKIIFISSNTSRGQSGKFDEDLMLNLMGEEEEGV
jgi:hAT family C-terminal dimerisation region